ncbi:LIC_12616 family protein [Acetobacter sp. A11-2]|uniref:phage neck terminator protein n=1 Tax=Acetobacter sp. A11-2 TaxID=3157859 RepID=UPI0032EC5A84
MAEEAAPRLSIILGQENRNSLPPFPFIVVTPLMSERLATNERRYHADGTETILQETRISFQVDFYGEGVLRRMTRFSTLFRDEIGCQWFVRDGCDIHPLYAEDRRQLPFVSDSQQWVDRWTISASLQLDQKIKINTGSATTVGDVGIVCVDRSA